MQVVYDGPSPSVSVPQHGINAERGEAVEVPDELGERLCRQATWHPVVGDTPGEGGEGESAPDAGDGSTDPDESAADNDQGDAS